MPSEFSNLSAAQLHDLLIRRIERFIYGIHNNFTVEDLVNLRNQIREISAELNIQRVAKRTTV